MNFQPQQVNNWQFMYFQLLNQYSSLAHNYHQQTESNNVLYRELEQAMQEKVSLLQANSSSMPTQVSLPLPQPEAQQASSDMQIVTKVKRHIGSMKRNGQKYKCKKHNCHRSYHTLMSLREHLKCQHGRNPESIREIRIRKSVT